MDGRSRSSSPRSEGGGLRQEELERALGDLARRVAQGERKGAFAGSLPVSGVHTRTKEPGSLIQLRQAARTGWSTGGVWEPLVYQTSPEIIVGKGLEATSGGVRAVSGGIYRISGTVGVRSTHPGSDCFLGLLLNGAPLPTRVKLDPEDLIFGATGLYYDGASLTVLAKIPAGGVVTAGLCVQGNPGLTTPANEGTLTVEQVV
jgi:hypothetical protein